MLQPLSTVASFLLYLFYVMLFYFLIFTTNVPFSGQYFRIYFEPWPINVMALWDMIIEKG
jgi:hypothetical protein